MSKTDLFSFGLNELSQMLVMRFRFRKTFF